MAAPRSSLSALGAQFQAAGVGPIQGGGKGKNASAVDDYDEPLLSSLEQQLRMLRKELKTKDDKITRLTEHAVMMGNHMDKLKGEVHFII